MIGRMPDAVIACVGGGSNAIGIFADFVEEKGVRLIGTEAAGHGLHTKKHAATLEKGRKGVLHGAHSLVLQDAHGQIEEAHSVSAGLDYPGIGPEHCYLQATGRAEYVGITDDEALAGLRALAENEGIIPALESSHALAHAIKLANSATGPMTLIVNISGRGDKDMEIVRGCIAEKGALPSTDILSRKGA
jgi:tryptophan synthase beta chain